jgi:hypothetical protein
MFRSCPQNFTAAGLENTSEEFSAGPATEWRRSSPIPRIAEAGRPRAWLSRPGDEGALQVLSAWAPCYAAASALAPNAKKRIML